MAQVAHGSRPFLSQRIAYFSIVMETNPSKSKLVLYTKSSCTRVKRRSTSVIKVGVAYVNSYVSRCLKEELAWAIDKRFRVINNKMLFKTVIPLRN